MATEEQLLLTQQELLRQQRRQRTRVSLQIQQEALRTGRPISEILAQRQLQGQQPIQEQLQKEKEPPKTNPIKERIEELEKKKKELQEMISGSGGEGISRFDIIQRRRMSDLDRERLKGESIALENEINFLKRQISGVEISESQAKEIISAGLQVREKVEQREKSQLEVREQRQQDKAKISKLEKLGIDVKALEKGKVDINKLNSVQQEALIQQGLAKKVPTEIKREDLPPNLQAFSSEEGIGGFGRQISSGDLDESLRRDLVPDSNFSGIDFSQKIDSDFSKTTFPTTFEASKEPTIAERSLDFVFSPSFSGLSDLLGAGGEELQRKESKAEREGDITKATASGFGGMLLGAGETILSPFAFAETFIKSPKETIKGIASGVAGKGKEFFDFAVLDKGEAPFKEVSQAVQERPASFAGEIVGNIALGGGLGKLSGTTKAARFEKAFSKLDDTPASLGGRQLAKSGTGESSIFGISGSKISDVPEFFRPEQKIAQEFDVITPTFRTGSDTFSITGGRARVKTRFDGDIIVDDFVLGARGRTQPSARIGKATDTGKSISAQFPEDFSAFTGSGFVMKRGQPTFREFGFGGVSKRTTEGFDILTTRPQSAFFEQPFRFVVDEFGNIRAVPSKVRGKITGRGTIKSLKKTDEDLFSIKRPSGGKKTPLEQTFGQELEAGFSQALAKEVLQESKKSLKKFGKQKAVQVGQDVFQVGSLGLGVQEITKQRDLNKIFQELFLGQQPRTKTRTKATPKQRQQELLTLTELQVPNLFELERTIPLQKQGLDLLQRQDLRTGAPSLTEFGIFTLPKIVPTIPPKISDRERRRILLEKELAKPHDVFIKQGGKFRKANEKPLPDYRRARDVGAYFVDKSLSANFKLKSSKKKPKANQFNAIPKNYFKNTREKFRDFRKRKGDVIKINKEYLEKRKFRLDSQSEVDKITFSKLRAEERRRQAEIRAYNLRLNNISGFSQPRPAKRRKGKVKKSGNPMFDIGKLSGFDPNFNII